MVDCRDFFKSFPAVAEHRSQYGMVDREEYQQRGEDHALELSLGLSVRGSGGEISKPKRSADSSSQSHSDVASACGLDIGNGELSRDQVWRALQKDARDCRDAASASLRSRRWVSMEPNIPLRDSSDLVPSRIQRFSSNNVIHPRSGMTSFLDRSPGMMTLSQEPQELLELQRKKELQAQRRLEARKRRKLLMEEKQQKKLHRQASSSRQRTPVTEDCLSPVGSDVTFLQHPAASRGQVGRHGSLANFGSEDGEKANSDISQEAERVADHSITTGIESKGQNLKAQSDCVHISRQISGVEVCPLNGIEDSDRGKRMPAAGSKAVRGASAKECAIPEIALSGQEDSQGRANPILKVPIARQQSWSVGDRTVGLTRSKGGLPRPSPSIVLGRGLSVDVGSLKFPETGIKNGERNGDCKPESDSSSYDSPESVGWPGKLSQCYGSFPDLPWVTTTGSGPNGKTISGVMYILNEKQVRLVCSCHGNHMTPAEFVQHSGSDDLSNPERSIVVNGIPCCSAAPTTSSV